MLAIPLKKSSAVEMQAPLRGYIQSEYSPGDADQHEDALNTLQQLRIDCTANMTQASDSSRNLLYKYYQQLVYTEKRFPVSESKVKLSFTWFDAFKPARKVVKYSLTFEQASVLFNCAAMESHAGVQCDRTDAEGLKSACKHFQQAAGIFKHLKENVMAKISGDMTSDFSPEGLDLLVGVMLGQAQACFYEKAVKGKMKEAIVSKLAAQAAEFYNQALVASKTPALVTTMDKSWGLHLEFQVHCFNGASQYWASIDSKKAAEEKGTGYGEEIGRLTLAEVSCRKAIALQKKGGLPPQIQETVLQLQALINKNKASAVSDNDKVYMERVPDGSSLAAVAKVAMVKPLPLVDTVALAGEDLFAELIPMEIHTAASIYSDRVSDAVRTSAEKVRSADDTIRSELASIGLPASIEAHEVGSGLPAGTWSKVRATQDSGGTGALRAMLGANQATSSSCYEMLASVEQMLAKEESEDEACRMQYGAKWERPKSTVLSQSLRDEVERYYQLLKEAKASDEKVAAQLQQQAGGFADLELTRQALDEKLPDNSKTSTVDTNSLSQLLVRMGNLIQSRNSIQKQLQSLANGDNMVSTLMRTGGQDQDQIFDAEMQKYTALTAQIDANITQQSSMRDQIVAENDFFIAARDDDVATKEREVIIRQLDAAVNEFDKLASQLQEGGTFYKDLLSRVQQLQQTTVDHCSARALNKRELLLGITQVNHNSQQVTADAQLAHNLSTQLNMAPTSAPTPPAPQYSPRPAAPPAPQQQQPQQHQQPHYAAPTAPIPVFAQAGAPTPTAQQPQQQQQYGYAQTQQHRQQPPPQQYQPPLQPTYAASAPVQSPHPATATATASATAPQYVAPAPAPPPPPQYTAPPAARYVAAPASSYRPPASTPAPAPAPAYRPPPAYAVPPPAPPAYGGAPPAALAYGAPAYGAPPATQAYGVPAYGAPPPPPPAAYGAPVAAPVAYGQPVAAAPTSSTPVSRLMDMGFTRADAEGALALHNGNENSAVNYLLNK